MARRHSFMPELLFMKILAPLVIGAITYTCLMDVIQDVFRQQTATIQAINQRAQSEQHRQLATAQQQKAAAAHATQLANEQYISELRQRAAAQRAKEQAWDATYQEPKGCDNWKTDAQMVACVDGKNAARRAFDQRWDAGEIPGSKKQTP